MNVLDTLSKDDLESVLYDFVKYNILDEPIDKLDTIDKCTAITINNYVFNKPCDDSIKYLIKVLMKKFDVSISVYYWMMACLYELVRVVIIDVTDIHLMLAILHCIGTKLVEDICYDSACYFRIFNIMDHVIDTELCILNEIFAITNPYTLFTLKKVDEIIYKSISACCNVDIEIIKNIDTQMDKEHNFYD